jgi:hypothetical protein
MRPQIAVVVFKKAAGMEFLKVTLPKGVFSQPPVIQVSTFFSTIGHVWVFMKGRLLLT